MRRHATVLAPILASSLLFVASWLLLTHVGFWKRGQVVDTGVYQSYGVRVVDGQVPYRDFSLEYPPGALPVLVAPALGSPKAEDVYRWRFEWLMALCGVGAIVAAGMALQSLGVSGRARLATLAVVGISPLVLGPVILTRYDLWPTALTMAALAAFLRDRSLLGGAALGLGAAAKVYPAVVAPVALAYVWQQRGRAVATRSLAAFVAAFAACVVPFAILAPGATLHPFAIQAQRPLEIESFGAALLIAAHHLTGLELAIESSYGSINLGGARADLVEALTAVLTLTGLTWVWVAWARRRLAGPQLATGAAAAVTTLVAFDKVFSPQYLIWLLPLVPLVERRLRRPAVVLLLTACALTQSWFPRRFYPLATRLAGPESWELLARDIVVAVLALWLAFRAVRPPEADAARARRVAAGGG